MEKKKEQELLETKQLLQNKFIDFEKQMDFMRDYFPDEKEKDFSKLLEQIKKAKDMEELKLLAVKLTAIMFQFKNIGLDVEELINKKDLLNGEETLWGYEFNKGFFTKKTRTLSAVTNKRVFIKDYEGDTINSIPINLIEDVVIMNKRRTFENQRFGSFTGGGYGGTSFSMGSGKSQNIGDVCIMFKGKMKLRFNGVSDPDSIKKLIFSVKKQTKV
jgi:hypothetical protein